MGSPSSPNTDLKDRMYKMEGDRLEADEVLPEEETLSSTVCMKISNIQDSCNFDGEEKVLLGLVRSSPLCSILASPHPCFLPPRSWYPSTQVYPCPNQSRIVLTFPGLDILHKAPFIIKQKDGSIDFSIVDNTHEAGLSRTEANKVTFNALCDALDFHDTELRLGTLAVPIIIFCFPRFLGIGQGVARADPACFRPIVFRFSLPNCLSKSPTTRAPVFGPQPRFHHSSSFSSGIILFMWFGITPH